MGNEFDVDVEKLGSKNVARLSIIAMFIGLTFVSFSNSPYFALFGFFIIFPKA